MTGELDKQPNNPNQLQEHKFQVIMNRFPNVTFWAQGFQVPAIDLPAAVQSNMFADIKRPGNKVTFAPLTISFILDEDLWNWGEIFSWITAAGLAENFGGRAALNQAPGGQQLTNDLTSDIRVSLISSKNNPRNELVFKHAWPTQLSGFEYSSKGSADSTLIGDVTFEYTTYSLDRLTT